jgi:formylmethanofuran dehydrogenase subunit E
MDVESLIVINKCEECGRGICEDEICKMDDILFCPDCYWFKMERCL